MNTPSTLPSVDLVFWCTTEADLSLAHAMSRKLTAPQRAVYLIRDNGVLRVTDVAGVETAAATYRTASEAQNALFGSAGQSAQIKLNDCDVLPDALLRLYRAHIASDAPSSEASFYPDFTDAIFKFQDRSRPVAPVSEMAVIGPQHEDFKHYAVDLFDAKFAEPKFLSLDLTRRCNKQCDKCMYHSPRTPHAIPRNESMPLELMKSILHQAAQFKTLPNVHPFLSGEPFLYEHLEEYLQTLNELGIGTSITTNGILLTQKNIDMLIRYDVSNLTISLDSITPDNYDRLQAPGDLPRVLDNIERLLDARDPKSMKVHLNFVVDSTNDDEFEEYLAHWLGKVDVIVEAVKTDNFGDRAPEYPYFTDVKHTVPCLMPWTNMCIRPNGAVSLPCSFDLLGTSSLNANDMPLKDIWLSEEYELWRKRFLDPDNERVKLFCKACNNCVAPSLEQETDRYTAYYTPAMATFVPKSHI